MGKIFSPAKRTDRLLPVRISVLILSMASLIIMLLVTLLLISNDSIIETPAPKRFAKTNEILAKVDFFISSPKRGIFRKKP